MRFVLRVLGAVVGLAAVATCLQSALEKQLVFNPACARGLFPNAEKWCSDYAICEWEGISCATSGRVLGITLSERNLQGTIPSQFGLLQDLDSLDLGLNSLTGTLPSELGWTKLAFLNLPENDLEGTIPTELGVLPLISLDLSVNRRLGGTIPPELGEFDLAAGSENRMSMLLLSACDLSGTIPPQLGNLQSLQRLELDVNRLTGTIPDTLANLRMLRFLMLGNNPISGPIPSFLSAMTQCFFMSLHSTGLGGTMPTQLGRMSALEHLFLANTTISGNLPTDLFRLTKLKTLLLFDNRLGGTIPSEIGRATDLQFLYPETNLQNNLIGGELPQTISALNVLQQLWIQNTYLGGVLPGHFAVIRQLNCSNTYILGTALNPNLCPHPRSTATFGPPRSVIEFVDMNYDSGLIQGELKLEPAQDESGLAEYVAYLGSSGNQKIGGAIGSAERSSTNVVSIPIPATAVPADATRLLAYASAGGSYLEQGPVSIALVDRVDVNECATNNGGCEVGCLNTGGSFVCQCTTGFQLGTDGVSCVLASASPSPSPIPLDHLYCGNEFSTVYPATIGSGGVLQASCPETTCTAPGTATLVLSSPMKTTDRLWAKVRCPGASGSWYVNNAAWSMGQTESYAWTMLPRLLTGQSTIVFGVRDTGCTIQYVFVGDREQFPQDFWMKNCNAVGYSPSNAPSPSPDAWLGVVCPAQGELSGGVQVGDFGMFSDCSIADAACLGSEAVFTLDRTTQLWAYAQCSGGASWYVNGDPWAIPASPQFAWFKFGEVTAPQLRLSPIQTNCYIRNLFFGDSQPTASMVRDCTPAASPSASPTTPRGTAQASATPTASPGSGGSSSEGEGSGGSSQQLVAIGVVLAILVAFALVLSYVYVSRKRNTSRAMVSPRDAKRMNRFDNGVDAELSYVDDSRNSSELYHSGEMRHRADPQRQQRQPHHQQSDEFESSMGQPDKSREFAHDWNGQGVGNSVQSGFYSNYSNNNSNSAWAGQHSMESAPSSQMSMQQSLQSACAMYQYPSWNQVDMFDRRDLAPGCVYVVVTNSPALGFLVFVWVGAQSKSRSDDAHRAIARNCLAKKQIRGGEIEVIYQGQEPPVFWRLFANA